MSKYLSTLGRVLLSLVFLGAVSLRLMAITASPDGYDQYLVLLGHFGLPGIFAPLLILIQLVGGLALLTGFKTRVFAYILAGFSLFLAVVLGLSQPDVMLLYLGLAGGLLTLALNPNSACSVDNLKK